MGFSSWLRNRISTRPQRVRARQRSSLQSFRPRLEVLECGDVPSTLTVTNNLDSGPGSLRADIATAHAGDTIVFAPSLDGHTITLTCGVLDINKNLTIQGPGASSLTVEQATGASFSSAIFTVDFGQTASLAGLKIANGSAGGIVSNSPLTVSGCTLSGNSAFFGGGIFNGARATTALTVKDSTAHNNVAPLGADLDNLGALTLDDSTVGVIAT
jgi:hypothetical protein